MALFSEADLEFTPEEVWHNLSRHSSLSYGVHEAPGPVHESSVQDW